MNCLIHIKGVQLIFIWEFQVNKIQEWMEYIETLDDRISG